MYSIDLIDHPECDKCSYQDNNYIYYQNEETIDHYLLYCSNFNQQRNILFQNIKNQMLNYSNKWNFNTQLLLTGYPNDNWHNRIKIVKYTCNFIQQTNRMKI